MIFHPGDCDWDIAIQPLIYSRSLKLFEAWSQLRYASHLWTFCRNSMCYSLRPTQGTGGAFLLSAAIRPTNQLFVR